MNNFFEKISQIYELLLSSKDSIYLIKKIDECKDFLGIQRGDTFGNYYYNFSGINKNTGKVYTPIEIAEYMVENTIKREDIINNPFLKIVDPSCGIGNIILPCFKYLKSLFLDNLEEINAKNHIKLKIEDVDLHIVKNNLFGVDIDSLAIKILQIDLFNISKCVNHKNYSCEDFLLNDENEKFDIYIGNPPYVGHKSIDKTYREKISNKYGQVYKDKGDLAYCFFGKAINGIEALGKVSFITSRYFLESLSGEGLRKLILDKCAINKIIDFYGIRPFKAAGIDPVIVFLEVGEIEKDKVQVVKGKSIRLKNKVVIKDSEISLFDKNSFDSFVIRKAHLGTEPWIIIEEEKRNIIEKIINATQVTLNEICESYQGIISGCDKAFIIDKYNAKLMGIERELLRHWIKSSNINKYEVKEASEFIIYSNDIDNEEVFPEAIKYIGEYKDKLIKRRECANGVRKWYELQWGRKKEVFEDTKIIFPYKASSNRFALDEGSYFSADVYALKTKDGCRIDFDFLVRLLNSKIYEFYFKSYAKKLGGDLYEYYPNNLMRLRIPIIGKYENINDEFLYNYFKLNEYEKNIIEDAIK